MHHLSKTETKTELDQNGIIAIVFASELPILFIPICLHFRNICDILSNYSVVSVIAATKFEASQTSTITFISVVLPLEALLCLLSNVSVVSVFAETKFETP